MSIPGFVPQTSFHGFAISFAATLLATTCAASAVTLDYSAGTITGLGINLLTPDAMPGIAGQIHLTTAIGTFDIWCVDLTDNFVPTGGTYRVRTSADLLLEPGLPPLSPAQIGEMGALALHGDFLVAHPGIYSSEQVAAAIQIAIWDIEYGTAFTYEALGSPIDSEPPLPSGLVAQYISNVGTGNPWDEYFEFGVFSATGNQTLLWAPEPGVVTPFTGTPEPSTWAMMLIGFAGLGFAGYRRIKPKTAFAQSKATSGNPVA
jgi:hypothetical protein